MPYRTKRGSHYHMTEGCHGATIPCDTKGLTPCSDCCGKGSDGAGAKSQLHEAIPAGTTVISGGGRSVSLDATVIETRNVGAGGLSLAEGTLYRLDSNLTAEQAQQLDSLPGVTFMPNEYSLNGLETTSAFIVRDFGTDYVVSYAQTISDLGIEALGSGLESAGDVDQDSIVAWLASNKESEWKSIRGTGLHLAEGVEPIHMDAVYEDYDALSPHPPRIATPARTLYALRTEPYALDYLVRQDIVGTEGLGMASNRDGTQYLIVYDGYEAITRDTPTGMRIGIRRHYDRPILRDVGQAEWKVAKRGRRGNTMQADGVAYRTPAGDAVIRMTVSPDPNFPNETRTSVVVDDPFLGRTISLASDVSSGSREHAMGQVCGAYLKRANIRAGKRGSDIRREYERHLPDLARRKMDEDGIDVTSISRLGSNEVEVRGLEGGYVPIVRRIRLEDDGTLSSYAK